MSDAGAMKGFADQITLAFEEMTEEGRKRIEAEFEAVQKRREPTLTPGYTVADLAACKLVAHLTGTGESWSGGKGHPWSAVQLMRHALELLSRIPLIIPSERQVREQLPIMANAIEASLKELEAAEPQMHPKDAAKEVPKEEWRPWRDVIEISKSGALDAWFVCINKPATPYRKIVAYKTNVVIVGDDMVSMVDLFKDFKWLAHPGQGTNTCGVRVQ